MTHPLDTALSDQRILETIGSRLRQARLNQDLTQAALATRAGLQRRTISKVENGDDFTMGTLLRVLRGLNQLQNLDAFLPDPGVSPIDLARNQGKPRQRASRNQPATVEPLAASADEIDPADTPGWSWGEDS